MGYETYQEYRIEQIKYSSVVADNERAAIEKQIDSDYPNLNQREFVGYEAGRYHYRIYLWGNYCENVYYSINKIENKLEVKK